MISGHEDSGFQLVMGQTNVLMHNTQSQQLDCIILMQAQVSRHFTTCRAVTGSATSWRSYAYLCWVLGLVLLSDPVGWLVTGRLFLVELVGGRVVGTQSWHPRAPEPGPPSSSKPRLPA